MLFFGSRACVTFVFMVFSCARSSAHDLQATVKVENDRVIVEAGYNGDEPASSAHVFVSTNAGLEVARGELNERGVWSMPRPVPGSYVVVVEQAGHRAEVDILVESIGQADYLPERLDKRVGMALGVVIVLAATGAWYYWRKWRRVGNRANEP